MTSNVTHGEATIRPPPLADLDVKEEARVHEAANAIEAEHNLGLFKSLRLYRKACLWSIFLSTCIVMEGFDVVLLNNLYAQPAFREKFGVQQPDGSYQLTAAWQAGLSNGTLCGQIFGLFLAGILGDRFGYRKTLIGALAGCCAFIFVIFFSETNVQLLIGEMLIGIPWGCFQTMTTTYAADVCPTHLRAYLTTYVNLCWVMGQFIASGVLRGMADRNDQWAYRIPFALQWAWPVPLMIGIYLAPESPWWLVRKGRLEEARRSLVRLTNRNTGLSFNTDETISMMVYTDEMEKEAQAGTTYMDLFRGVSRRRTELVCFTWVIQTLCGSTFMGFSTFFLQSAGMSVSSSFSMSLVQYALGGLGTLTSWFLMMWFGRRTLYLSGQLVMAVFLLIIGCVSLAGRENASAQWAIGALLLVYAYTYNCTVGPICYSLVAELSSTRLRTKSVVVARAMYNGVGIITNILTPLMLNPSAWNWGAKAGFFWAGSCLCCAIWTFWRLPEPKGRTYTELDTLFEMKVSARKFKSTVVEKVDGGIEYPEEKENEKESETVMVERVSPSTTN